jgi:uncharacterized protein (DUF362 family)
MSVVVSRFDNGAKTLSELSFKVGFHLKRIQLALVKPNICGIYPPSLELLSSVIQFLSSHAASVVIGETSSVMHNPKEQFRRLGVQALVNRSSNNVQTADLSGDPYVRVGVPHPHVLTEIDLPKTVMDAKLLVNVPKVGRHSTTRVTCALKNLFGLLPLKRKYGTYHPLGMDKVIADIAQIIKPDLNIVDTGNKVIIGRDALTVDIVACRFVNVDPLTVDHFRLVSEDRDEKLEDFIARIKVIET